MKLFKEVTNTLLDIIYKDFESRQNYFLVEGKISKPWYNLLVPKVKFSKKVGKSLSQIIEKQPKLSLYIESNLLNSYTNFLNRNFKEFDTDVYIARNIENKKEMNEQNIRKVDKKSERVYLQIAQECFPDWDEIVDYSKLIMNRDKCHNFIYYSNNTPAAIASLVLNRKDNLCYMHNFATKNKFRRRGIFTRLVRFSSNYCLKNGTARLTAIVQPESPSHIGYTKLGFNSAEGYHLFVRKE